MGSMSTARAVLAFLSCVCLGCWTPPALPAAGWGDLDLIDYPPGAERVEIVVADDRTLVGAFVPAGDGAPLVVVLPGAAESATLGCRHDLRLRPPGSASASSAGQGDGARTQVGGFGMSMHAQEPHTLFVHAELGWPAAPFRRRVGFTAFGVDLADELEGRELPLSWSLVDELADLGFSTLIVDYGGIGASTGERTPALLAQDTRAIWDAALERVNGESHRIVLRGTSLGTVAVATLLEGGARPGGVVLVAPVRGETVVGHFARWTDRPWTERLALPFLSSVTDADLVSAIEDFGGPLHVVVPEVDALLPAEERALLQAAGTRPAATWAVFERGHESLALAGHALLPGERDLYARADQEPIVTSARLDQALAVDGVARTSLADSDSPSHAGLGELLATRATLSPAVAAALALEAQGFERAERIAPWLLRVPASRFEGLDLVAAQALLDLDDPDGGFDSNGIAALATLLSRTDPAALPALTEAMDHVFGSGLSVGMTMSGLSSQVKQVVDGETVFAVDFERHGVRIDQPAALAAYLVGLALRAETEEFHAEHPGPTRLSTEVARRRAVRRLLFGLGVPNRIDGEGRLEAWREGTWSTVWPPS